LVVFGAAFAVSFVVFAAGCRLWRVVVVVVARAGAAANPSAAAAISSSARHARWAVTLGIGAGD